MHDSALLTGRLFAQVYGKEGMTVVDVGGLDENGSLRSYFEDRKMKYICVDIAEHSSVDIVVKPGDKLPFSSGSIDLVVSTSCFEHDPCFWMTFREMSRICTMDGYIYVNAPADGNYHCYPGDNYRFYADAAQALAFWASKELYSDMFPICPVKVVETFHVFPMNDIWTDFVCVWQRSVDVCESQITLTDEQKNYYGMLRRAISDHGVRTGTMTK